MSSNQRLEYSVWSMGMYRSLCFGAVLLTSLYLSAPVFGQGVVDRSHVPSLERVDPFERRNDVIDGNNIRTTITNWAQTGQSGNAGDFNYEWPKNTNRIYIALSQLWVGAEVTDENGEDLWIVEVSDFRFNPVDENRSWTFEPIQGYVNPAGSEFGIAQSDEPDSWPSFWPDKLTDADDPGWPGSWNGLFGKSIFNADQEFFYKVGDDQYDRYPTYFPDSTDLSRKGLGLITEVRTLAWSQILIDDVIFLLHAVKNDGTEDLDRVGFSLWLADLVGGDSSDDIPFFDLLEDVAFMTDADGIGTEPFGTDPVGVASFAFLETPGNASDRIDNDADGSTSDDCISTEGECNSPVVQEFFLAGENPNNGIDDNNNGLVDENPTHIPFSGEQAQSPGVGYADFIDNDGDGETGGPTVSSEMIGQSSADAFLRWPPNPGPGGAHLIGVDESDLGRAFKDGIDNDDSHVQPTANYPFLTEPGSPVVTQEMVDAASSDPYGRYTVPGTSITLYAVGLEDLGKAYADGVDNDGDGAVDEGIDEGIDEMIDESRADGIDNDGDWNPLQNDLGLDGVAFNGDPGDGDGFPTTGAGTGFPGERNIDVTDVSESDQIGITNVQIIPAFFLNFNTQSDRFLYFTFMIPGDLDIDIPEPGENDLVITSSLFPLRAGQTERISVSVQLGLDQEQVLDSRDNALQAYLEDYQFAQAPITPLLTAVPGNGKVTLYWDSDAEESFDQFLDGLGLDAFDFEGYRIYRSTDPAFLDATVITDGFGNRLLRRPIAQFDKINSFEGFHPVDVNGVKFYLGNNRQDPGEAANGLTHMYVDDEVTNGITYFYAVTAYDFGAVEENIPPTETPVRIRRSPDGLIETGRNVVEVVPSAPAGGFSEADVIDLQRARGFTSSRIGYNIVDSRALEDNTQFSVTFEDTLKVGASNTPDTLTTKNFTLTNLTTGEVVLDRSTFFGEGKEFPIFSDAGDPLGFSLSFFLEPFIVLNTSETAWNRQEVYPIAADPYLAAGFITGLRNPADYRIEIVGEGEGQSTEFQARRRTTLPSRPTNVKVFNVSTGEEVKYAFWDLTGDDFQGVNATTPATFSASPAEAESDRIIILEPAIGSTTGEDVVTWQFSLNFVLSDRENPVAGDVVDINIRKPFLSSDEFTFSTRASFSDQQLAQDQLENIQVVPNPYVVTNRFEPLNPFSTGRGPRVLQFTNLPPQCTVRIYTISGKLVRTLERNSGSNASVGPDELLSGILEWDLESEDNLTVSYGVYLYHVEAPEIGEHEGTFAIIK
ncbi:MAG: hypothetical protein KTR29_00375 [Rhodothermaceae bacterium]|nr:hypothetical protein [Rhodothermaceae bacterium]